LYERAEEAIVLGVVVVVVAVAAAAAAVVVAGIVDGVVMLALVARLQHLRSQSVCPSKIPEF
jgi:hypothetical protein